MHTDSLIGQRFHDDHHRVIDLLNDLDAFLTGAGEGGIPEPAAIPSTLLPALEEELGTELDRHFAEEEALFPAIAAAGGHELTADLSADHESLRPLARRLARLCALVRREGFDAESWPVFAHFGGELVEGLVLHIQKEESSLLPAIDAIDTLLPAHG